MLLRCGTKCVLSGGCFTQSLPHLFVWDYAKRNYCVDCPTQQSHGGVYGCQRTTTLFWIKEHYATKQSPTKKYKHENIQVHTTSIGVIFLGSRIPITHVSLLSMLAIPLLHVSVVAIYLLFSIEVCFCTWYLRLPISQPSQTCE